MEAKLEEVKRRCRSVEESIEKELNSLNSSCKQTLLRLLRSELSFLSQFPTHNHPNFNLPLSVNIGHLEAVVYILKQPFISGVSRVCKPIPRSNLVSDKDKSGDDVKGVYVDIVCNLNGYPVWFIVSDRNPKYVSWQGSASYRNKGLKTRIEHVLDAARSSISLRPSSIILFFANGLENDVSEGLRGEFAATDSKLDFSCFDFGFSEELEGGWVDILARSYERASVLEIKVDCVESSIPSCSNVKVKPTHRDAVRPEISASIEDTVGNFESFRSFVSLMNLSSMNVNCQGSALLENLSSESGLINFDTTALIAIVSGISNGSTEKLLATPEIELRGRFKNNYEFVIAQVMSEVQNPIHMELGDVVSDKVGIVCESVCSEFKELVSMCGGPNEKSRAKYLLEHLIREENPPPRNLNSRRIYIRDYRVLRCFEDPFNPLTELAAYEALRYGGPMMGTVLATREFLEYRGGIIRERGTAGDDLAHSVAIVGMDREIQCFKIQSSFDWGDPAEGESVGCILYHLVYDILQPVLAYPYHVIPYRWGITSPRSMLVKDGSGHSSVRGSRGGLGGIGQRLVQEGWGGNGEGSSQGRRGKRHGDQGLEGEVDCPFYLKTGSCKYGATCHYNHPDTYATNPPAGAAAIATTSAAHLNFGVVNPAASMIKSIDPRVVPDSPSTRMMSLATTRKLALKNKIVFGTGDSWHAPTLTANMAFVRAVAQTGMSLLTIEHRPRALTGD